MKMKIHLIILIVFLPVIALAQSRGVISCPDFSNNEQPKMKFGKEAIRKLTKAINKRENIIKITPYIYGSAFSVTDVSTTTTYNGTTPPVTTGDTNTVFQAGDFKKTGGGILLDYETGISKKSSIQISMGYDEVDYAEGFKVGNDEYSTYSKGSFSTDVPFGITTKAFVVMGAYRNYFKRYLRGLYVSPYFRIRQGWSSYTDTIFTHDKNDFDFKEKSSTLNIGGLLGYQWLIYQKMVIDLFVGPQLNVSWEYDRKFMYSAANEENFAKIHNDKVLLNAYESGAVIKFGVSIGYLFGKKL